MSLKDSLGECTDTGLIVCKDPAASAIPLDHLLLILRWDRLLSCHTTVPALLTPGWSLHNYTEFCGEAVKRLFLIKAMSGTIVPSQAPAFASLQPMLSGVTYSSGLPNGFAVRGFWRMQTIMVERKAATGLSFFPGNFFSEATEWDLCRRGWWPPLQNAWPVSQCETFPKYATLQASQPPEPRAACRQESWHSTGMPGRGRGAPAPPAAPALARCQDDPAPSYIVQGKNLSNSPGVTRAWSFSLSLSLNPLLHLNPIL